MTARLPLRKFVHVYLTMSFLVLFAVGFISVGAEPEKSLDGLVPGAARYTELSSLDGYRSSAKPFVGVKRAFLAYDGKGLIGMIVQVESQGYNVEIPINSLVGFDGSGTVVSVKVVSHGETPGWDVNLDEGILQRRFLFLPRGVRLFLMQQLKATSVGQVEAVTGATTTSKGLSMGVQEAREFFEAVFPIGGQAKL